MTLSDHSIDDLAQIADALSQGRLSIPFASVGLGRLGVSNPPMLSTDLNALADKGLGSTEIGVLLAEVIRSRRSLMADTPTIELVATGPDARHASRDTGVVVDQLFSEAKVSVLVAGFALYRGDKIFETLAEKFDATPNLEVRMCLDISRRGTDTTKDQDLVAKFAYEFLHKNWPGHRRPKLCYYPRGLAAEASKRAVLHAKCIVIDNRSALITSANPTPAAYDRNIEIGLVIRGGTIPQQISAHFESLIATGTLREVILSDV